MRVLLVEDDTVEALAMQRELAGRFDLRVAATLAEALQRAEPRAAGGRTSCWPIPACPIRRAGHAARAAGRRRGHAVVVSTGRVTEGVRRQLDALGRRARPERIGSAMPWPRAVAFSITATPSR